MPELQHTTTVQRRITSRAGLMGRGARGNFYWRDPMT